MGITFSRFMDACHRGDWEKVEEALQRGGSSIRKRLNTPIKEGMHVKSSGGWVVVGNTALCVACASGSVRTVEALLRAGASVHVAGCHGLPLEVAADGSESLLLLLLRAGADATRHGVTELWRLSNNDTPLCVLPRSPLSNGNTQLLGSWALVQYAARGDTAGALEAVDTICGVRPSATAAGGQTALHAAAAGGHDATVAALLRWRSPRGSYYGAFEVDARDGYGWTPLMHACWHDQEAAARVLLNAGASTAAVATGPAHLEGAAPLDLALQAGAAGVVELLLEHAAAQAAAAQAARMAGGTQRHGGTAAPAPRGASVQQEAAREAGGGTLRSLQLGFWQQMMAGLNHIVAGSSSAAAAATDIFKQGNAGVPAGAGGTECVICLDAARGMVFTACGHLCVCTHCGASLTRCPVCRAHGSPIRVYT